MWVKKPLVRIPVRKAEQLTWTLLPADEVFYELQWFIDMQDNSIVIPSWWLNIRGLAVNPCWLTTTSDNHTFFTWGTAWDLFLAVLTVTSEASNTSLWDVTDWTWFNAVEMKEVNFFNLADMWEWTWYRQIFWETLFTSNVADWFTFSGTMLWGVSLTWWRALATWFTGTMFKAWTGLTFGNRFISNINISLPAWTSWLSDFSASNFVNDSDFQLQGIRIERDWAFDSSDVNYLPNIDESSVKSFFRDCLWLRNTRPWFETEFTVQATTQLTEDILAKAEWTTLTTNNVWWTQTDDNEITYNSALTRDFRITVNITVDWGANDELAVVLRKWDNSASAYVDLKTRTRNVSNVIWWLDVAQYNFVTRWEFDENDRIELWLRNNDDGTDATVLQGTSEIFVEVI